MDNNKECVILAGGFGTRLQSVVKDVPKCMAEVAGRPFLYYIFKYLEKQNFTHIILSLGYKSDVIIEWITQNRFKFEVSYVIEEKALGTGGAIKFAMTKSRSNSVFVINGDTYFGVNLPALFEFSSEKQADIAIALKPMISFDRYGSVELNNDRKIISFNEKKFCESGLINGGIYLINKNIYNKIELPEIHSFEKDILENTSLGLNIFGYTEDAYFIDIGIPEDFSKANTDFLNFEAND